MLAGEHPYLIYLLGTIDADPEALIEFRGLSPRAKKRRGWSKRRALVVIAFFRLDDASRRKNLFRDRACLILAVYPQLVKESDQDSSAEERLRATDMLSRLTADDSPHANCVRSFVRLFRSNPAHAALLVKATEDWLSTMS